LRRCTDREGANGAFLRAGLVDELNLILCPAVDGAKGAPSVFDSTDAEADRRAPVTAMTLESSQALEGGAMLLRYRIQNAGPGGSGCQLLYCFHT
jgi:riboflavin biosynthesis pyrimidine reductase